MLHPHKIYARLNTFTANKSTPRKQFALLLLAGSLLITVYGAPWKVESKSSSAPGPSTAISVGPDALALNAVLRSGTAQPLSLASEDFDGDGIADLVSGYNAGSGILRVYRGNSEATAPSKPDVLEDLKIGRFAPPFLPEPKLLAIPEPPDFLAAGDFNRDGYKDVLAAARGSQGIYVLKGDGRGGFAPAEQVFVPGRVTALAIGEIGVRDGLLEIAVGISGADGSKALIFQGASQGLWGWPSTYELPADARALALGELNDDQSVDLAVAAGNRVLVIAGSSQQEMSNGSARAIEQITFPFAVAGITVGQFIWDREGRSELAAMSDDGTIQFSSHGDLDKRPYSDQEEGLKIQKAGQSKRQNRPELFTSFMKSLVQRQGKNSGWVMADTLPAQTRVTAQSPVLFPARISNTFNEDLVFVEPAGERLGMLKGAAASRSKETLDSPERLAIAHQLLPGKDDLGSDALPADGEPVAALAMRLNVDTKVDLVILRKGQIDPIVLPSAVNATYTVDRTDDTAAPAAQVCSGGVNDCSLRGAIIKANTTAGDDTITFLPGAQTYTLTLGPFDDEFNLAGADADAGDLDIRDAITAGANASIDGNLTIAGNGIDVTIVEAGLTQATGIDRVFDINNFSGTRGQVLAVFSNMTIRNGNAPGYDVDVSPAVQLYQPDGGGIHMDGLDTNANTPPSGAAGSLTVSGCKITTNLAGGTGGGIHSAAATVIINSSTLATEISSNQTQTSAGGGVYYLSGNTIAAQNMQITGATITLNTAGGNAPIAIGGGIAIQGTSPGVPVSITNAAITNNTSTAIDVGDGSGGGGIYSDDAPLTMTGGSITLNKANSNGGGILFVGPSGIFNNVNISSNTADFNNDNVGNGGGLYHLFGALTIGNANACTFNSNTANNGGGIYVTWNDQVNDSSAAMTMTNGTISSNNAKNNGGGLAVDPGFPVTTGNVTLNTVTLQSNTANSDSGSGGDGGGIYVNSGTINSLNGVTIDSNAANVGGLGDGIRLSGGSISAAGTVNINGSDSLYLSGGTFTSTTGTLNLTGNFTRDTGNTFNANNGTFNFNGTGAQLINGTATSDTFHHFIVNKSNTLSTGGSLATITTNNMTMTAGSFTAPATLDINGQALLSAGTLTAGASILANLDWTNNGGTFTPGSGTVTFDGGGGQSITGSAATQTFNHLTINKSGGSTLNTAGSTNSLIVNNLTNTLGNFSAPATLDINGNTLLTAGTLTAGANITAAGNWTNNGGTFTPGSGTVTFDTGSASNLTGTAATQTFNNFTVNKGGGSLTGTGSTTTLTLNGSMTLTAGTFAAGTITTINLPGNWTNNGVFTANSSTVVFNGTGAITQTVSGNNTFHNLTIAQGAGATTAFGATNTTVANTFSRTGGTTMDPGTGTFTFTGGAGSIIGSAAKTFYNLVINPGAVITNPSGGNITIENNFTNSGTFTQAAGINTTFDNSAATHTLAGGGATTFGSVIISGVTALDAGSHNFSVAGANFTISNAAGAFTGNTGTVTFIGTIAQTIGGTGAKNFNNLTINNGVGGSVATTGSSPSVAGLLLIQAGSFTTASNFNNVQINGGATLAGTNLTTMNVTGSWTNNGGAPTSFTSNGNTVNFNGSAAQTIGGNTATVFNNLTIANPVSVTMTQNETVNGLLTLTNDLTTGANTLSMPPAATSGPATNAADVLGNVKRNFASTGVPLSFGNPFNTIAINSGLLPIDINVHLIRQSPTGFAGSVDRTYTITPNGLHGPITLRLHYLDSELDGNAEGSLNLRRFNGVGWQPFAPTLSSTGDTTNNWLEHNNVTTLSPWTFSDFTPTAANGTVTGRITDGNGFPVEGAVVRLSGTQNRKFITDANGAYRFEQVETSGFYTVTPSRANYTFSPASRSFSQIGQTTDAAFDATAASSGLVNPLDTPEYFVRQNYLDFLGREPDEAGFNFWSNEILGCGGDAGCVDRKRTNVSAAYFLSIEFQQTGGLVDGLYRASFARRPSYLEFKPDAAAVAPLLVVGSANWQATLENGKKAFLDAFVQRAAFRAAYDGLSNDAYVDALITNTGAAFTSDERNALVNGLAGGMSRATVLRAIVEDADAVAAKRNEAFVMMEYFGYLRREPDAVGYTYWLDKLNHFNGNFEQAEMVRAFIISDEYRNRFPR